MTEAEAYFGTRLTHDVRREQIWSYLTPYLQAFVPPQADILELGAGYCYFVNNVAARRRVAVDLSPEMLRWKGPGVEGICEDVLEYLRMAEPSQFDFILASNFFEHFEWPALNEIITHVYRVLRPSGRLAIIQPNFRLEPGRYFDDYTHRAIFTDVSLGDWLTSCGFKIAKLVPRFLPLTVKSRLGGLSFLIPLYLRSPIRPLAGQMFALADKPESTGRTL